MNDTLEFMLIMFGMCFNIVGMIFFWVSPLKYGFEWWNVLGIAITTFVCCIPMILEWRDKGKLDLRPRFMK